MFQNDKSTLSKLYPWFIWFIAASFFFYKYFIQVSPSVISHDLMSAFHLSGLGLGHLAACFFYAYLLMQIPAGMILDRYNPLWVLFVTLCVCASSLYIFSQSETLI